MDKKKGKCGPVSPQKKEAERVIKKIAKKPAPKKGK